MIHITSMCKELNCLPSSGGLLDQDPYLIDGMGFVLEASHERQELDAKKK